jgi:pimeloyl-ACP methyl ester carboxylesterase
MKTPQDQYIKVGTINTRYWAEGAQGPIVLLIHGLGGYIETWLPSIDALAAEHRVVALDLPGHGRTDKPLDIPYKIADMAQFVKNFMRALEIEHAQVIGHSLGGAISTRLTIKHPEVVDRLVLAASAGLGKEGALMLRILCIPILGELLTRPSRSGTRDFYKGLVYEPSVIPDELIEQDYQMTRMPNSQRAFLKTLRANCTPFGQRESMVGPNLKGLPSIKKPVCVIWGREDPTVPVAHVEIVEKNLPNAQVKILEHCGHLPMFEHTQAFNQALLGFLEP